MAITHTTQRKENPPLEHALEHCKQWFGDSGSLSKHLLGYQPRQAQIQMAASILEAIDKKQDIICEAGTGVGKTLAYLLPCLDASEKVILATATKALQKQLYEKDVPLASQVFGGGIDSMLLKGKENYLSKTRLQGTWNNAHLLSPQEMEHLKKIQKWSERTELGDRADCTNVPEISPVWKMVCMRPGDPLSNDDFYLKARNRAKKANLLIINQHLLCAELTLHQQSPKSSLLNDFKYVIVDEAHQLRDVATMSFGSQVTRGRLIEALEQAFRAITQDALAYKDRFRPLLVEINQQIERVTRFFMRFQSGRYSWQSFYQHTDIGWINDFIVAFDKTIKQLGRHKGEMLSVTHAEFQALYEFLCLMKSLSEAAEEISTDRGHASSSVDHQICWLELFEDGRFTLYLTPIQVHDVFNERKSATTLNWIYTSATLTVANTFEHFRQTLGIDQQTQARSYASPFNFKKQVAWYQPKQIPPANHKDYIPAYLEAVLPICRLCEGRSFLLFCSYAALYQAEKILRQDDEFTLFVQGTKNPHQLLQDFTTSVNALLLGTKSFWEGVDVRGQQLSFVAIDKLPFSSPGEPLNQAREEWYKKRKRDSFKEYFLPQAVISLKQGFGRLIRDTKDYGILMIGDNRIHQKNYGKQFIESLPVYEQITDFEQVSQFWQDHQQRHRST